MSTRTITVKEEAYERLKAKKEGKESFSDVILKITGKRDIMEFAGILSNSEAEEARKRIKEARKLSVIRMEQIGKRLSE